MDSLLEKGAAVRLEYLAESFFIAALQGRGGSCAVYRTEYMDATGNRNIEVHYCIIHDVDVAALS